MRSAAAKAIGRRSGIGTGSRGSDFSEKVVGIARANAAEAGIPPDIFTVCSIYDLGADDGADLLV